VKQRAKEIARALVLLVAAAFLGGALRGLGASPAAAGGSASVRLEPASSAVDYTGGTFTVRVELEALDHHGRVGYDDDNDEVADRFELSNGLGAFEILLRFDPGVVAVAGVDEGDFFDGSGREAQCLERTPRRGQYAVGCVTLGSGDGPQGSGLLVTLTLRPLANGVTYLALESQLSGPLGDPITVGVAGGAVEVRSAPADAPPPPPPDEGDGDGNTGGPVVIGGGTPGDVSNPGSNGATGAPSAGTGYTSPDPTLRPLIIGGSLAATGALLLFAGVRLGARRRRL
jgi:hypothetical protein